MFLIISPFDDIWTIKNLFPHDLHIYLIIYMKKICTIHTLKNPPHLVILLGKIQALSIEVLYTLKSPKTLPAHHSTAGPCPTIMEISMIPVNQHLCNNPPSQWSEIGHFYAVCLVSASCVWNNVDLNIEPSFHHKYSFSWSLCYLLNFSCRLYICFASHIMVKLIHALAKWKVCHFIYSFI